jgi:hypothetical protein
MKPICHLNRMRCALFGGRGINATTIPSNHFYARMLFQPSLQALHRPIGQEVDHLPLIQVHQNGPLALAFAPGPVIYSQMSDWIAGRDVASSLHRPNHRIVADSDGQPVQNAAARQSPRGVANQAYDLAHSRGPASRGSRDFRYRFSKDLACTSLVAASKAPRFQAQFYCTPLPRPIFQPAKVRAVTAPRHFAALWTTGCLLSVNIDQESVVPMSILSSTKFWAGNTACEWLGGGAIAS